MKMLWCLQVKASQCFTKYKVCARLSHQESHIIPLALHHCPAVLCCSSDQMSRLPVVLPL